MTNSTKDAYGLPLISIICPVHNEEGSIERFYSRLLSTVGPLEAHYTLEIIFMNNCSSDGTLAKLVQLNKIDTRVHYITLSRNFGYQGSLLCGLHHARGNAIVIIDVDCEDPPELIPTFIEKWKEGYDIVYGERRKRPEAWWIQALRKLFYRLAHAIADVDFIIDMAEFSLLTRRVRDQIIAFKGTYPFLRSELAYVGFRRIGLPYSRQVRAVGKTHYNFIQMFRFAVGGILSSSTFPLRAVVYFGLPLTGLDVLWGCFSAISGSSAYALPMLMVNLGLIVFSLSFIAIYLARIYKDGVARPTFIVDWKQSQLSGRFDEKQRE